MTGFFQSLKSVAGLVFSGLKEPAKISIPASDLFYVFEPAMIAEDSQNGKCAIFQAIKAIKEYIDISDINIVTDRRAAKFYNALTKIQKHLPADITPNKETLIPAPALLALLDNMVVIDRVISSLGTGVGRGISAEDFIGREEELVATLFTRQAQTADKGEVKADLTEIKSRLTQLLNTYRIADLKEPCLETELFGKDTSTKPTNE